MPDSPFQQQHIAYTPDPRAGYPHPGQDAWLLTPLSEQSARTLLQGFQKFELPPALHREQMLRLLLSHSRKPRWSRKQLAAMPLPLMEALVTHWLCESLGAAVTDADRALSERLAEEELAEFSPAAIVQADLALLAEEARTRLHSYYYRLSPDAAALAQVLQAHGYSGEAVLSAAAGEGGGASFEDAVYRAYWRARRRQAAWPWQALIAFAGDSSGQADPDPSALTRPAGDQRLLQQRPYRRVILVEGSTECLMLPALFLRLGLAPGCLILPAGGKNQMTALYRTLCEQVALPLTVLLDRDADVAYAQLSGELREQDVLVQIEAGEFEDLYTPAWITAALNLAYPIHPRLSEARYRKLAKGSDPVLADWPGLTPPTDAVGALKLVCQVFGLGKFDKMQFAGQMLAALAQADAKQEAAFLGPSMRSLLYSLLGLEAEASGARLP